jgi:phage baseplate assembly protein W
MPGYFDFPMRIDPRGHTATTAEEDHVRDLIWQVLFTSPGERVNRPDFGCGLKQLVFLPNSDALAAATEFLVLGSLQRWVEPLAKVRRVEITSVESTLEVTVVYQNRLTAGVRTDRFTAGGPAR